MHEWSNCTFFFQYCILKSIQACNDYNWSNIMEWNWFFNKKNVEEISRDRLQVDFQNLYWFARQPIKTFRESIWKSFLVATIITRNSTKQSFRSPWAYFRIISVVWSRMTSWKKNYKKGQWLKKFKNRF